MQPLMDTDSERLMTEGIATGQAAFDRLLVETDAPYLAPQPYRGKRNEPAYVVETARYIAEMRGLPIDELEGQTAANARRLFGIDET